MTRESKTHHQNLRLASQVLAIATLILVQIGCNNSKSEIVPPPQPVIAPLPETAAPQGRETLDLVVLGKKLNLLDAGYDKVHMTLDGATPTTVDQGSTNGVLFTENYDGFALTFRKSDKSLYQIAITSRSIPNSTKWNVGDSLENPNDLLAIGGYSIPGEKKIFALPTYRAPGDKTYGYYFLVDEHGKIEQVLLTEIETES